LGLAGAGSIGGLLFTAALIGAVGSAFLWFGFRENANRPWPLAGVCLRGRSGLRPYPLVAFN
jgi:hypothetical protein